MGDARHLNSDFVIPSRDLPAVEVPLGEAGEPNGGSGRGL
jgi:hypothetical protein